MKKRIFLRIFAIALIAVMLISAVSCTPAEEPADGTEEAEALKEPKTVEIPVFAADVKFGSKIMEEDLTTKTVNASSVATTMVTSVDDVIGKYASADFYAGDYIYKGKLSNKRVVKSLDVSEIEKTRNKYVDVSQFVKPNAGVDVYAALQKLIDTNKNRTLYFPDGEYIISRPLQTSAAASASNSFYLSDNAVIKASDSWLGGSKALIELGGAEEKNDIQTPGSNYFFIGGILDGNGKAKGISLASGRESLVSKVKIINATVGIYVPEGVNNKSSDMDIEDIDIIGNGGTSKGIVVIGIDNNFTDIRISNVRIGVENSSGNFFRGVSVRLGDEGSKTSSYDGTIAFQNSGVSWFYSCSSENMQTGFSLGGWGTPVIKDFSIRWTSAKGAQTAFATNRNIGTCSNGIIDFFDASTENSIVKLGRTGDKNNSGNVSGILLDVIADTDLCDEEIYKKIFVTSKVGE